MWPTSRSPGRRGPLGMSRPPPGSSPRLPTRLEDLADVLAYHYTSALEAGLGGGRRNVAVVRSGSRVVAESTAGVSHGIASGHVRRVADPSHRDGPRCPQGPGPGRHRTHSRRDRACSRRGRRPRYLEQCGAVGRAVQSANRHCAATDRIALGQEEEARALLSAIQSTLGLGDSDAIAVELAAIVRAARALGEIELVERSAGQLTPRYPYAKHSWSRRRAFAKAHGTTGRRPRPTRCGRALEASS